MLERFITAMMLIIAMIHLAPLAGLLGVDKLHALYEVRITDPNLEILMRHRAVLFGLLGVFFAYSALQPSLQFAAFGVAAVSIISFLLLAHSVGAYNATIAKVVMADYVALTCLVLAVAAHWYLHVKSNNLTG